MKLTATISICAFATLSPALSSAQDGSQWIVTGSDVATGFSTLLSTTDGISREQADAFETSDTVGDRTVAQLGTAVRGVMMQTLHDVHHRCGGFTVHPTREAAVAEANNPFYAEEYLSRTGLFPEGIDQQAHVAPALDLVDPARVVETIQWMEALGTRYYQTDAGQNAALTLKTRWEGYGKGVEFMMEVAKGGAS